ncbi:endo-1,4-beta-xylanase [Sphaerisporangium aureirubrum]|uniref:Beta-xylanase n=1 Tax=Sphaerisporangium aureirubrum TaxID=1544736 RepID=A0ABW1NLH6_9ACTN
MIALDPSIKRHRTTDVTLTVTSPDGTPLAGQEVVVAQRNHRFLFGCIGFDLVPYINGELTGEAEAAEAERMAGLWLDLFNFSTLPFYWGRFEPERGRPDTRRVLAAARWFADRGLAVKGHPLAWHTSTADWLMELSNADVAAAQVARIQRELKDFAGVIGMWDVINEVVIMPVFDKYDNGITRLCREIGRIPMIRMVFDAARDADHRATLLLNDFDMSSAYECLIEGVLEAGIQIDALGLQSHMHQGYWGEEKTLATIDRFARYGLPIHFTESTLLSGHLMPPEIVDLNDYKIDEWPSTPEGEARQADEMTRHYTTLLSHPAVEAITYWGFTDKRSWLGAPAGFFRADATPKPSYEALHSLIKGSWWLPPTPLTTDENGRTTFTGFLGDYDLTTAATTTAFQVDIPGETALRLTC